MGCACERGVPFVRRKGQPQSMKACIHEERSSGGESLGRGETTQNRRPKTTRTPRRTMTKATWQRCEWTVCGVRGKTMHTRKFGMKRRRRPIPTSPPSPTSCPSHQPKQNHKQSSHTIANLGAAHIYFIALQFPLFAPLFYYCPRLQPVLGLPLLLSSFLAAIDDLGQLPVRRLFDNGRPAHHLLAQSLAPKHG